MGWHNYRKIITCTKLHFPIQWKSFKTKYFLYLFFFPNLPSTIHPMSSFLYKISPSYLKNLSIFFFSLKCVQDCTLPFSFFSNALYILQIHRLYTVNAQCKNPNFSAHSRALGVVPFVFFYSHLVHHMFVEISHWDAICDGRCQRWLPRFLIPFRPLHRKKLVMSWLLMWAEEKRFVGFVIWRGRLAGFWRARKRFGLGAGARASSGKLTGTALRPGSGRRETGRFYFECFV